jgi:ADP-ribosylglycohydrolase
MLSETSDASIYTYHMDTDYCRRFTPDGAPARIAGMVIGHALGDAIGLQTEFQEPAEARLPYASTVRGVPLCDWTDDTDLLICIIMSMCDHNGALIPKDIAERYVSYLSYGLKYFGDTQPTTPNQALRALVLQPGYVDSPFELAGRQTAASGGKHAIGVATSRACLAGATRDPPAVAEALTLMTNPDPRCVAASVFIACMCNAFIFARDEHPVEEYVKIALEQAKSALQDEAHVAELSVWYSRGMGKLAGLELGTVGKATYVMKSFGVCVYCCQVVAIAQKHKRAINPIACLRMIASMGGDADTNCACAGAILGAYVGVHGWQHADTVHMPNYPKLSGIIARWVSIMFRPSSKDENADAYAQACADAKAVSDQCIQPRPEVEMTQAVVDPTQDASPQIDPVPAPEPAAELAALASELAHPPSSEEA